MSSPRGRKSKKEKKKKEEEPEEESLSEKKIKLKSNSLRERRVSSSLDLLHERKPLKRSNSGSLDRIATVPEINGQLRIDMETRQRSSSFNYEKSPLAVITEKKPDTPRQSPDPEGYLMKKNSRGRWKRRWVALDPEFIFIHKDKVLAQENKSIKFYAESEQEAIDWVNTIKVACESAMFGAIGQSATGQGLEDANMSPEKKEVLKLLEIDSNKICAECADKDPKWASINLGVFICIDCSGVHRSLGVHISKVRSIYLDNWEKDQVEVMRSIGNAKANEMYGKNVPPTIPKPIYSDGMEAREMYIRAKYCAVSRDLVSSVSSRVARETSSEDCSPVIGSPRSDSGTPMFSPRRDYLDDLKAAILMLLKEDPEFRQEVRLCLQSDSSSDSD